MARHVFLTGPPGIGKTTLIRKASEVLKSSGVPVDGFYTEEVRQGGRRVGFDVVTLSGLRGPLSRVGAEPPPGRRDCRVGQYVVDLPAFERLALPVLRNPEPRKHSGWRLYHCRVSRLLTRWVPSQRLVSACPPRTHVSLKSHVPAEEIHTDVLLLFLTGTAGSGGGPGCRVCVIDEIGKMELFSQPFAQAVRQTLSAPGTVVLGTIPVPKGKPLALVEEIRSRVDVRVFSVTKENRDHLLPDIVTCVRSGQQ